MCVLLLGEITAASSSNIEQEREWLKKTTNNVLNEMPKHGEENWGESNAKKLLIFNTNLAIKISTPVYHWTIQSSSTHKTIIT